MFAEKVLENINFQRAIKNYLSIGQTIELAKNGNIIIDPFSVLISKSAKIGANNIFYPTVIVEINDISSSIEIGNNNIFYPQSFLLTDNDGHVFVGNSNHFEGGVSIKANMPGSCITIGDYGRYLNGAQIIGRCNLGSGSQIIGNITVQNCTLEEGESYLHKNPDLRGGLLKGFGLARDLVIEKGKVIDALGKFDPVNIKNQSFFHPKKAN